MMSQLFKTLLFIIAVTYTVNANINEEGLIGDKEVVLTDGKEVVLTDDKEVVLTDDKDAVLNYEYTVSDSCSALNETISEKSKYEVFLWLNVMLPIKAGLYVNSFNGIIDYVLLDMDAVNNDTKCDILKYTFDHLNCYKYYGIFNQVCINKDKTIGIVDTVFDITGHKMKKIFITLNPGTLKSSAFPIGIVLGTFASIIVVILLACLIKYIVSRYIASKRRTAINNRKSTNEQTVTTETNETMV